ncbi:MAG: type II secretion system F family protein [candidate division WOR-3 bacterium]
MSAIRHSPFAVHRSLFAFLLPLVRRLAGYNRLLPLGALRQHYTRQVERAGLSFELSGDEFIAIQEISALAMAIVAALVYLTFMPNALVAIVLVCAGLLIPYAWLSAQVDKHRQACLKALPGFMDMLVLAVEAGMGFDAAVRKLTEVMEPSPLIERFQFYLRSVNVGEPRAAALRETARRLDLPDFTSLANAVIQAAETGSSISAVLRAESRELLLRRFERAEKVAAELPIKMLLPLFAFIFPATFLMIIGPLYFQFVASGAGGVLQ